MMRRQARSSTRVTGRSELLILEAVPFTFRVWPLSRQIVTNRVSHDYAAALALERQR